MKKSLAAAAACIALAAATFTVVAVAAPMEMAKETGVFTERGNNLKVGAHSKEVLCPKGGVYVTALAEHAIRVVSQYCMSDATVDKLIGALEEAKAEAAKIREFNK